MLQERLEALAIKMGSNSAKSMIEEFFSKKGKTYADLVAWLAKNGLYYSESYVKSICRDGVKVRRQKKIRDPKKMIPWDKLSIELGYSGLIDLLQKWPSTDAELSKKLNVTRNAIFRVRLKNNIFNPKYSYREGPPRKGRVRLGYSKRKIKLFTNEKF